MTESLEAIAERLRTQREKGDAISEAGRETLSYTRRIADALGVGRRPGETSGSRVPCRATHVWPSAIHISSCARSRRPSSVKGSESGRNVRPGPRAFPAQFPDEAH